MAAAREYIRPLAGDYLQAEEVKHLAKIIYRHTHKEIVPAAIPLTTPNPVSTEGESHEH